MSELVIASFELKRLEILDACGQADEAAMPDLGGDEMLRLYELMVLSRSFDRRAVSLQREGRLGTYPPILGQEAAQVGSAFALAGNDWVFPSFRETGVYATLGYPLDLLYRYWAGDERGLAGPAGLNILPACVSVSTQIPQAVGAAMAIRYRKDPIAAAVYFGEGATSKGDFHEGLNIAGAFKLPVVFICQNNQWAISMSRDRQSAAATIAQKAVAYGFEGLQVDGNDVLAVYAAVSRALDRARKGGGPSLVECHSYRMGHHTTSDDAGRYRDAAEVEAWKKRDPIERLGLFLERRGILTQALLSEIERRCEARIDEAVRMAEAAPPPEAAEMFTSTFAALTPRQESQLRSRPDGRP
ncbi:MAG: pyruvate dehydrogenase (acetyl-transferring) E1 component subunit alpha [Rectinemataceae bacterium]